MVGYSLFCMRDPGSIPVWGSIFLEIWRIAIFFFRLQGLDFIESSFACIQSFSYCNFFNTLLEREFWVSTCYCVFVTKMHVGKNMMNIPREANQDKTSMSKGPLKKFTNLNSFLIVKQGNIEESCHLFT